MRTYDVAMTSLAIDAPLKWTDNLLAHHSIADVVMERRGVARKISHSALLRVALIRELNSNFNLGIREAIDISARLWAQEGEQHFGVLRLTFDRAELVRTVERRLRDALESAPTPRRGRPVRRGFTAAE